MIGINFQDSVPKLVLHKRPCKKKRKRLANLLSEKKDGFRPYTELCKRNSKKINIPIRKWAKDWHRHFSKEDMHLTMRPEKMLIHQQGTTPSHRETHPTRPPAAPDTAWKFLVKLGIVSVWPAAALLVTHPREMKVCVHTTAQNVHSSCVYNGPKLGTTHVFPKVNKKTKVGSIHTVDIS